MPQIKLRLLGTLHITQNGQVIAITRRKSLALLSYLAVTRHPQSRDTIATLLWPEYDESRARAALRTTISELNNSPLNECLEIDRTTIALRKNCDLWVDVHQFQSLLSVEEDIEEISDPADYEPLEEAIQLYRDDFLAGFTLPDSTLFDSWQSQQKEALHNDIVRALSHVVDGYHRLGEIDTAIKYALRWLAVDPLNENVHLRLMQLYVANGQRTAALRQYEECVRLLEDEMGIEPHSDINQFYDNIKAGESELFTPAPALNEASVLPPVPGLTLGREEALDNLLTRLGLGDDQQPVDNLLTIVQGWPGVGKSTLIAMLAHHPRVKTHFRDGVLWTSLGETPNLLSKLEAWGRVLGISDLNQAPSLEAAAHQLAAALRERRVLLLVDDVWQTEHAVPFKIVGTAQPLIMTTRFNDVADKLTDTPTDVYKLPILDEAASLSLLRTLAPKVVDRYSEEVRALVQDLEGLPLALQVAGRLLHAEEKLGWGVQELLDELREGTHLLEASAPADRVDLVTETTPTVAVLIQKSVERLSAEMQEKFALLGVFAPKPATFDLPAMSAVWEEDDPRPSARRLVERGLLEPIGQGWFQMHALLAMHARSMFEE